MNAMVRTAEALELLMLRIERGIAALPVPEIPVYKFEQGLGDEEQVVLLLSDLQIGHRTPTTSAKIIQNRLRRLAERLIKIVTLHRSAYPIDRLNLFVLGDLVQGEEIGRMVGLDEMEIVLVDQMFKIAIPSLETFMLTLLPHFPGGIDVWCVSGNHGRIDKFHAERTNFDTIIYQFLEARLRNCAGIRFHIEAHRFYQKVKIWKWTFLLTHGDQTPMHLTLPWYGLTTRSMRFQGSLPGDKFQYLTIAHFHIPSWITWNDVEIFTNGCFVTDDQWVLKKLGLSTKPAQLAFGVHPRKGVTFRYQIRLD